jgi:hypothetical protein
MEQADTVGPLIVVRGQIVLVNVADQDPLEAGIDPTTARRHSEELFE